MKRHNHTALREKGVPFACLHRFENSKFKDNSAALCLFALSAFILTVSQLSAVESPRLVPFQARLTDQAGTPFTDGQFTLTFNIYGLAVGGTSEWTERHEKVGVINSMVNVFLGSIEPLNGVDFSQTKYLGITIDADGNSSTADPEMVPRQIMIPAFHAKTAEDATKLAGSDWSDLLVSGNDPTSGQIRADKIEANGLMAAQLATDSVGADEIATQAVTAVEIADGTITRADLSTDVLNAIIPAGTIVPFAGPEANVPPGWEFCDGRALDKDADGGKYQALHDAIGTVWGDGSTGAGSSPGVTEFNLPDFRGMFLRGAGVHGVQNMANGSSYTGGAVGLYQHDRFQGHLHNMQIEIAGTDVYGGGITSGDPTTTDDFRSFFSASTDSIATLGSYGTPRVGGDTRPASYSVTYIIKY